MVTKNAIRENNKLNSPAKTPTTWRFQGLYMEGIVMVWPIVILVTLQKQGLGTRCDGFGYCYNGY